MLFKWLTEDGKCPYRGTEILTTGEWNTTLTSPREHKDFITYSVLGICENIPYKTLPAKLWKVDSANEFDEEDDYYWYSQIRTEECYGTLPDGIAPDVARAWVEVLVQEELEPKREYSYEANRRVDYVRKGLSMLDQFIAGDKSLAEKLVLQNYTPLRYAYRSAISPELAWQCALEVSRCTTKPETKVALAKALKTFLRKEENDKKDI